MNFENIYIDELVCIRKRAREKRNWVLSDQIRAYLDTKHTFVFDTNEGQVVYHDLSKTRQELIENIKKESRAERMFNAYLTTVRSNKKAVGKSQQCLN